MKNKAKDRDIDNDQILLDNIKKYYNNNIEQKILYWHLDSLGYSKEEIDRAISDYYWIYIRTEEIINNYLCPLCCLCAIILCVVYLLT